MIRKLAGNPTDEIESLYVKRVNCENESCLFGISNETFLLLCLVKFKLIFDLFWIKGFSISSILFTEFSYTSFIFIVIRGTSYNICISILIV